METTVTAPAVADTTANDTETNVERANTIIEVPKGAPVIEGGKDNVPAGLSEVVRLQGLLGEAQATIKELRETSGGEVKLPVTDSQLRKACDALIAIARANPGQPSRSLKSQFLNSEGVAIFVGEATKDQVEKLELVAPELTTDQGKRVWKPAKKEIDALHDAWVRKEAKEIVQHVHRGLRATGIAQMRGRLKRSKDGKRVTDVMIGAKFAKAPKPDGKPDLGKANSGA